MPWHVEKRGDEYCVIKDSDGSNEGCSPTRAKAEDHMKALYASENDNNEGASMKKSSLRIAQAANGWHVIEHAGTLQESVTLIAAAREHVNGVDHEISEREWRTTYAQAVALVAARARAALIAQAGDEVDDDMDDVQGLLEERWVCPTGQGIVYARATGDGRDFTGCTFTWRDPNVSLVPLMLQTETDMGHFGAELAGFVEEFASAGDMVTASGRFYDNESGEALRDMLQGGRSFGVSVDGGMCTCIYECISEDQDGWCIEDRLLFTEYEIIGVTGTPFPAFFDAAITLEVLAVIETEPGEEMPMPGMPAAAPALSAHSTKTLRLVSLNAAATDAPAVPPREWFEMAEPAAGDVRYVDQPGGRIAIPMTITDDGQVFGHLASRGSSHTGFPGRYVPPPVSPSNCAHFNVGATPCDDGSRIATGVLTVGCDHAPLSYTSSEARDFYAHSGLGWADVHASEGEHGVWVAGALRPGLSAAQLRMIHGSSISGDWRPIGGALELLGAHLVNQPGFPIVREAIAAAAGEGTWYVPANCTGPQCLVKGDEMIALVAAGVVRDCVECAKRRHEAMTAAARDLDPLVLLQREVAALTSMLTTAVAEISRIELRTRHLRRAQAESIVASIHATA